MSTSASDVRRHRFLALAAILHAAAILAGVFALFLSDPSDTSIRLWVGVTTLWFVWPFILAFDSGRTRRRTYVAVAVSALLLVLPMREYLGLWAPRVFGGDDGPVSFNPYDIALFSVAYAHGWVRSQRRGGDETITLEGFGMGGNITPGVPPMSADAAEKYKVRVEPIAGCGVDSYILGRASGYNAVSAGVLKRRHGAGVIAILEREWTLEQERWQAAHSSGRADAARDIEAGHLALEVLGKFPNEESEFDSTLLAGHGITLRHVANGIDAVSDEVMRHAWGYNEVVEAEINRRFGAEVAKAADAARSHYYYSGGRD